MRIKLFLWIFVLVCIISSVSALPCNQTSFYTTNGFTACTDTSSYTSSYYKADGSVGFISNDVWIIMQPNKLVYTRGVAQSENIMNFVVNAKKERNSFNMSGMVISNNATYTEDGKNLKFNLVLNKTTDYPAHNINWNDSETNFEIEWFITSNKNLSYNNIQFSGTETVVNSDIQVGEDFKGITLSKPFIIYKDGQQIPVKFRLLGTKIAPRLRIMINFSYLTNASKYPIIIDPSAVAGCDDSGATDFICANGTFTGNDINTTKNITIRNATINGAASAYSGEAGRIFINTTGWINVSVSNIYGHGYTGSCPTNCDPPGCNQPVEGRTEIYAVKNINISNSNVTGYGGDGPSNSNVQCNYDAKTGFLKLFSSTQNILINTSLIDGHGGSTGGGSTGAVAASGTLNITAKNISIFNESRIYSYGGNSNTYHGNSENGGSGYTYLFSENNIYVGSNNYLYSYGGSASCPHDGDGAGGTGYISIRANNTVNVNTANTILANGGNSCHDGGTSLNGGNGYFVIDNTYSYYPSSVNFLYNNTININGGSPSSWASGEAYSNFQTFVDDEFLFHATNVSMSDAGHGDHYINFSSSTTSIYRLAFQNNSQASNGYPIMIQCNQPNILTIVNNTYIGTNLTINASCGNVTYKESFNTNPNVSLNHTLPSTNYWNNTYVAQVSVTDVDGNNITYCNYSISDPNGVLRINNINGTKFNTSYWNSSSFVANATGGWVINVTCSDDSTTPGITTLSWNLTINNTAPTITGISTSVIGNVTSQDILCLVNATDTEGNSLTYNYDWHKNGVSQGINNVALLYGNDSIGDKWACWVNVSDSLNYTTNMSSNITFISQPPNTLQIVPIYADLEDNLYCEYNISRTIATFNVSGRWWESLDNGTTWSILSLYNWTDVGVNNTLVNGSVYIPNTSLSINSLWKCEVYDGETTTNSSERGIYQLENLTIYSPPNYKQTNQTLNVSFSVISNDGGISCNLTDGNNTANSSVVNATVSYLNVTQFSDGEYLWNISCVANGHTSALYSSTYRYDYDTAAPFVSLLTTNANSIFPQIGDTILINGTVSDLFTIDTCILQINDTGSWINVDSETILTNYSYVTQQSYTIPAYATANDSTIGYRFFCNDSAGNSAAYTNGTFIVRDTIYPTGYANPNNFMGNFTSNTTIFSGINRTTSYFNFTFTDNNLFAIEVNITCDINNTIYNFTITGLTQNNYTVAGLVNMSGLKNQKCYGYMAWSDDHTAKEIPKYENRRLDNGIEFKTPETEETILVESMDDDFSTISTKKLLDRMTFTANYETKQLYREFIIPVPSDDTILYPRYESSYPAHIVAWNKKTFNGNWIDFKVKGRNDLIYETEKLDNGDIKVMISVDLSKHLASNQNIPIDTTPNDNDNIDVGTLNERVITDIQNNDERIIMPDATPWYQRIFGIHYNLDENIIENYGMDRLQFETIGGVLITYLNFTFYVGGDINTTMDNQYDHSVDLIHTYNLTVTNSSVLSYPYSVTNYSHGNMSGLPNGTYLFQYNSSYYFPRNYTVLVENSTQNVNYSSCQAGVNFNLSLVQSGTALDNFTVVVNNTITGYTINQTAASGQYNISFCLNASNYTYTLTHPIYSVPYTLNGTFSLNYLDNLSIGVLMPVYGQFLLLDEKTEGAFNISSPNEMKFWLFCSNDTTYVTTINNATLVNNTFSTLINCNYDYFRFTLDWGTDNYYRTFILSPTQAVNYTIYLIDLATTTSVSTSFVVDDLLTNYNDASLWAYKVFTNGTNQISADYIDVEAKVTFFLIENNEYILELHSSNKPIVSYGKYVANTAGTKKLTTYTISMNVSSTAFASNVNYGVGTNVVGNTSYYTAHYADTSNSTTSATLTIYQNSLAGPVLYTQTVLNSSLVTGYAWVLDQNTTNPSNSTVFLVLNTTYNGLPYSTVKKVQGRELQDHTEVKAYIGTQMLNWIFLIVVSVIILLSTITTGSTVALFVCGFALLMKALGWTTISFVVIMVAIIIAWISFMKKGEQEV